MAILTEVNNRMVISAPAEVINFDYDTASQWATKHVVPNPALKYIKGRYVEADNPNQNGQMWALGALRLSKATLSYAPLNLNHQPGFVGTVIAGELIYPTNDTAEASHPFIETISAFWYSQFPELYHDKIEPAYASGSLYHSMECVSKTLTCMTDDCDQTFKYEGAQHESYCEHINSGGVRLFNEPHFLASALIAPPIRPGWNGADIQEIAHLIKAQGDSIVDALSHDVALDPGKWEEMMVAILASAKAQAGPSASRIARTRAIQLGVRRNA